MLGVLPPIFVADTKIIYGHNFVAPLKFAIDEKENSLTELPKHLRLTD